jgi:hypothetical protein
MMNIIRFRVLRNTKWPIWLFGVLSWGLAVVIIILNAANIISIPSVSGVPENITVKSYNPHTVIKQFQYIFRDPLNKIQPILTLNSEWVQVDNGNLGILKTGLHKIVTIKNLNMECSPHFPDCPLDSSRQKTDGPLELSRITSDLPPLNDLPAFLNSRISQNFGRDIILSDLFDFSNADEFRILGFKYTIRNGDKIPFFIHSKLALMKFTPSGFEIYLKGHVTITHDNGDRLESNVVQWDIKRQCFIIEGNYILSRNGIPIQGKAACVDWQFNPISRSDADFDPGEKRCFAKM